MNQQSVLQEHKAGAQTTLSVAVVIPTKNRPDDLDITVQTLLAQTVLPQQVIIVDQSSGDEGQTRVRDRFAALDPATRDRISLSYLRDTTLGGLTAARNRALREVHSDIVLFLDDDVELEADFIHEILAAYERCPGATGVSGIITSYSPPPLAFRCWTRVFSRGPFHDDRQPVYWNSRNLASRSLVRVTRLGGGLMSFRMTAIAGCWFDENLTGACPGEDVEFTARLGAGAVLLIAPGARLIHKQTPVQRSGEHWLDRYASTMWYLYLRNWNHGIVNRVWFAWLNVGLTLAATAVAARRMSLAPWRNLRQAIAAGRGLGE